MTSIFKVIIHIAKIFSDLVGALNDACSRGVAKLDNYCEDALVNAIIHVHGKVDVDEMKWHRRRFDRTCVGLAFLLIAAIIFGGGVYYGEISASIGMIVAFLAIIAIFYFVIKP